ncbi:MAG: hypothetical protein AAF170_19655 [Bacteroidota bacterium]
MTAARLLPLFVLTALVLGATSVAAQPSRSASPQVAIAASDGPSATDVRGGGEDRNAVPGSGCSGFINNGQPTATVTFGGEGSLSIYAKSSDDTTILVASPDGKWHCSDDANGSNPGVTIANAGEGTYVVWIGTFSPDSAGSPAQLFAHSGSPQW